MRISKTTHFTCILAFSLLGQTVFAQQNSLKIYGNFHYLFIGEISPQTYDYTERNNRFSYDNLSLAYRMEKGLVAHELDFAFQLDKERGDDHKVNHFQTHLGYEYSRAMKKKLFSLFTVRFGGLLRTYYLREKIEDPEYNLFPVKRTVVGYWAGFFTHLECDLSKRIYLNVNTSIISAKADRLISQVDDPNLTEEESKSGGFGYGVFYEPVLRMGIGYRFF